MAVEAVKIDSSETVIRITREASLETLPAAASQHWYEMEPNEEPDFGADIIKKARRPISTKRGRKKGSTVDLNAAASFQTDLTMDGSERLWEPLFYANRKGRGKNARAVKDVNDLVDVSGAPLGYNVLAGDGSDYLVNDLVYAEGFTNAANNGLKVVSGVTGDIVEFSGAVAEGAPPAGARIWMVGHQFASGDLSITKNASELPTLDAAAKSMADFSFVGGEWIFIGGDDQGASGDAFNAAHNNGIARIYAVEGTTTLRLDKTSGGADGLTEMLTEVGGTKTIRVFMGEMLRNLATDDTDYAIISHHVERRLGKPNPVGDPTRVQSEVVQGAHINEAQINIPQADLVTVDWGLLGTTTVNLDGDTGNEPLSDIGGGTKIAATGAAGFNTSSDFTRIKLSKVPPITGAAAESAPDPLSVYFSELTLTIGNTLTANKAVSRLGAFAVTAGEFVAGLTSVAYFNDIAAVNAVRNNDDVTLDIFLAHTYNSRVAGMLFDIPLASAGNGKPDVNLNEPVRLPIDIQDGEYAAFGFNASFMEFWYLPSAADA